MTPLGWSLHVLEIQRGGWPSTEFSIAFV